jgi:hypothetical protein
MGQRRNEYRIFVGRRDRKRLLGRHRFMWDDNIKTDLKKVGWEGMDWIALA